VQLAPGEGQQHDPVHTAFLHALSSGYQFTEAFGVVPESTG
jgi:hypothetical protein